MNVLFKQIMVFLSVLTVSITAMAFNTSGGVQGASDTAGTVASLVTNTFGDIGHLITAGSYIAGLAFGVAAIMKFKQHKDNPTQIPIGTPLSLVAIAIAFLFFPTFMKMIGVTMFGAATTAGPKGLSILNTSS